jgi:hypothetical protein
MFVWLGLQATMWVCVNISVDIMHIHDTRTIWTENSNIVNNDNIVM